MQFTFATATEILFGAGVSREVAGRARREGRQALVVTGRDPARAAGIVSGCAAAGLDPVVERVAGEPGVEMVAALTDRARRAGVDVVVAVGGGSVLDAAKAVSAMLTNPGDVLDYLEVVGRAQPLARRALPVIAVPTTAGTGAEVTRNAVLGVEAQGVKASMRSVSMIPRVAIVDPELTLGLPADITAATGMDALTQLIEPFVSPRANPITDGLALEGLRRIARSLRRAYTCGSDLVARTDMSLASLMGGLCLANAGLGAAHGFAAPVGGRFHAPHGAVCGALLPATMRANVRALRARADGAATLGRYQQIAAALTGADAATADEGIAFVDALRRDLRVAGLGAYGVTRTDAPALAAAAANTSSMRGNPVALTAAELEGIVEVAL